MPFPTKATGCLGLWLVRAVRGCVAGARVSAGPQACSVLCPPSMGAERPTLSRSVQLRVRPEMCPPGWEVQRRGVSAHGAESRGHTATGLFSGASDCLWKAQPHPDSLDTAGQHQCGGSQAERAPIWAPRTPRRTGVTPWGVCPPPGSSPASSASSGQCPPAGRVAKLSLARPLPGPQTCRGGAGWSRAAPPESREVSLSGGS